MKYFFLWFSIFKVFEFPYFSSLKRVSYFITLDLNSVKISDKIGALFIINEYYKTSNLKGQWPFFCQIMKSLCIVVLLLEISPVTLPKYIVSEPKKIIMCQK